jgi:hypothetical protein
LTASLKDKVRDIGCRTLITVTSPTFLDCSSTGCCNVDTHLTKQLRSFDKCVEQSMKICRASHPKRAEAIAKDSLLTANQKLFFHAEYHPDMTSCRRIHQAFRDSFGEEGSPAGEEEELEQATRLTIAYSRAPNIGDLTVRTTLSKGGTSPCLQL